MLEGLQPIGLGGERNLHVEEKYGSNKDLHGAQTPIKQPTSSLLS